jgi:hypothetical protein
MDILQESNNRVLNFLATKVGYRAVNEKAAPVFAPWNSVADPYTECGCHPGDVSRLWNQIGKVLPSDCRALVCGNPSLVHDKCGIMFGVAFGTCYIFRLPGSIGSEATNSGLKTSVKFSTGEQLDLPTVLGDEWVFGNYQQNELDWSKKAYEVYARQSS